MCLNSSGNRTHVEIQEWHSWRKHHQLQFPPIGIEPTPLRYR